MLLLLSHHQSATYLTYLIVIGGLIIVGVASVLLGLWRRH